MNFKKQFNEGLLTKNPVTVQLLGMCSTLAITTSLFNGIGMGLAVTIILTCSNILISDPDCRLHHHHRRLRHRGGSASESLYPRPE